MVKRHFVANLETIETRDDSGTCRRCIRGYAAKFDSPSLDLGGFTEKIQRGAFKRSLMDADNDVMALYGHDYNQPIGRRSAGTLNIREDDDGLAVEIYPDNTTWGQNAYESVRSGNVKGMSFGFDVQQESWDRDSKVRTLQDIDLYEVSLTALPAYPSTEASVRALDEIKESYIRATEAKTKRVDGEDLSADDFLIVGDKDDPDTWKLPWHFSSEDKTKAHLRNALARFDQLTDVSEEDKKAAHTKLVDLCKKYGIDVSEDSRQKYHQEMARFLSRKYRTS